MQYSEHQINTLNSIPFNSRIGIGIGENDVKVQFFPIPRAYFKFFITSLNKYKFKKERKPH